MKGGAREESLISDQFVLETSRRNWGMVEEGGEHSKKGSVDAGANG